MINPAMRLAFENSFNWFRRSLNNPVLYAVPWQVPPGTTYDQDVDAWIDGDGDVVVKSPSELTYYAIPALWGPNAATLALGMGGLSTGGDLAAIAKAEYRSQVEGAMMVVTGSLTSQSYTITNLENAPDGGAAIFVVMELQRREA